MQSNSTCNSYDPYSRAVAHAAITAPKATTIVTAAAPACLSPLRHWQRQNKSNGKGKNQGNGNDKLVSFVVLAMVEAAAVAKVVVSLLVCTMAKTLADSACIHGQIFFQQLPAAKGNKQKQRAAFSSNSLQQQQTATNSSSNI